MSIVKSMSIKLFGRFGDGDVERVVPSLPLFARLAHCELLLSDATSK